MQQVERLIDSILGPVLGPVPAAETAATEPPPHALYRDLIDGVGASPVLRLAVGRAWILVRTAHSAGLAYAPRWPVGIVPARLERLDGVMLRDLASLALRRHALAAAIGMAAINAQYNRPELDGSDDDGLTGGAQIGPTVVIGRFPGLDDKL